MASNTIKLRRQITNYFFTGLAASLSVMVVSALVAIFAYLVLKGAGSLNWSFLTQTPKPVGETGGGMANAMVGSMIILRYPASLEFRWELPQEFISLNMVETVSGSWCVLQLTFSTAFHRS